MLGVGWASPQQESQGPGCSSRQKDGPSCRGLWMPGWCLLWRRGKAVGSPSGHALGGCGAAALCLLRSQRVCGSSPPLFCGDCGLCHTLVTGPARHVAVTLCSPRTQASFLRLLRPKRVGAGSKTVPPERCTQLVAPTLIQGRGREDADEQGY